MSALPAGPNTGEPAHQTAAALPGVLREHALDAVHPRLQGGVLVRAPRVTLGLLGRHYQRIAAYLDWLAIAGPAGVATLSGQAAADGAGDVGGGFAPAALALLRHSHQAWHALLEPLDSAATTLRWRGFLSALRWVSAGNLRGVVQPLLAAARPAQLDLSAMGLESLEPRASAKSGDDETAPIDLDEDDSLPWLDVARVQACGNSSALACWMRGRGRLAELRRAEWRTPIHQATQPCLHRRCGRAPAGAIGRRYRAPAREPAGSDDAAMPREKVIDRVTWALRR